MSRETKDDLKACGYLTLAFGIGSGLGAAVYAVVTWAASYVLALALFRLGYY